LTVLQNPTGIQIRSQTSALNYFNKRYNSYRNMILIYTAMETSKYAEVPAMIPFDTKDITKV